MAENVWNIFLAVFVIDLFIFWIRAVGDSDGECHYEDGAGACSMTDAHKGGKRLMVEKSQAAYDSVNHPSHYTEGHRIEVIDFLEDWLLPFHLSNCIKYICRAGRKDPDLTIQDLEKAEWYLKRYIEFLKKKEAVDNEHYHS